jgi:3-deoxy-manno-octulosonate cytidylyltransferase (CMP-KDO synthetase)
MPRTLIVIPARFAASRLAGKPLADIAGEPMIVHVWRRAVAAAAGRVVVATDADAVAAAVRQAGGEAVMTRADHVSGSDRVFEAVARLDPERAFELIVNVQGDMPTLDPRLVAAAIEPLAVAPADGGPHIGTIAAELTDPRLMADPNIVKVVGSPLPGGRRVRALYFTRAAAPYGDGPLLHHEGLYAFRRAALERFVALPPSPLELRESLEQLRALEDGMRIEVTLVDRVPLGVNTEAELQLARRAIADERAATVPPSPPWPTET